MNRYMMMTCLFLLSPMGACSDRESEEVETEPTAGEEVEEAAEEAGESIEEGAEDTGEAVDDAAEDVDESVDENQ